MNDAVQEAAQRVPGSKREAVFHGLRTPVVGRDVTKERYRTMRGYKRPQSALDVSRLLAWCGNHLDRGGANLAAHGARMPFWDRDIDLLVVTRANARSLNGLLAIIDRYRVEQTVSVEIGDSRAGREWLGTLAAKSIAVSRPDRAWGSMRLRAPGGVCPGAPLAVEYARVSQPDLQQRGGDRVADWYTLRADDSPPTGTPGWRFGLARGMPASPPLFRSGRQGRSLLGAVQMKVTHS